MMSDDMLSQDEIDALLRGTSDMDETEGEQLKGNDLPSIDDYLTSLEQDALGEIGNISFGSSATALSTLLNHKVEITTPSVSIIDLNRLQDEFPQPYVAINVKYTEGFSGTNLLVVKTGDAGIIADLMLGGDGRNPSSDMGDIHLSAVQEAMNQMMGSSATSMSTIFNKRVDISPPAIDILDVADGAGLENLPEDTRLVKISFRIKVGDLIDSTIMQLLQVDFCKALVEELMNPQQEDEPLPDPPAGVQTEPEPVHSAVSQTGSGYGQAPAQYQTAGAGGYQHHAGHQRQTSNMYTGEPKNVQQAVFSDMTAGPGVPGASQNLDMLLDIPLQVTVELGRTNRTVKDILELSSGSIIELDKLAGEPVDILVNKKLIAKGEVVVIEENFGVRVTDIVSQTDRILKLK
ncbi:flagellar motor switch phosphatase FliY [Bacillus marinisedimentorum]|uniref:flagellar motor switch phosphatase FliY n=1 Tax=Bacillus marinisedimentorum TaxID=1821260 RepID=UPI0007DEEA5F|nr:flagellar motor switch phosphatase FliY [Bacillus marinisedimentorum]